jgi:hypothetical protein
VNEIDGRQHPLIAPVFLMSIESVRCSVNSPPRHEKLDEGGAYKFFRQNFNVYFNALAYPIPTPAVGTVGLGDAFFAIIFRMAPG